MGKYLIELCKFKDKISQVTFYTLEPSLAAMADKTLREHVTLVTTDERPLDPCTDLYAENMGERVHVHALYDVTWTAEAIATLERQARDSARESGMRFLQPLVVLPKVWSPISYVTPSLLLSGYSRIRSTLITYVICCLITAVRRCLGMGRDSRILQRSGHTVVANYVPTGVRRGQRKNSQLRVRWSTMTEAARPRWSPVEGDSYSTYKIITRMPSFLRLMALLIFVSVWPCMLYMADNAAKLGPVKSEGLSMAAQIDAMVKGLNGFTGAGVAGLVIVCSFINLVILARGVVWLDDPAARRSRASGAMCLFYGLFSLPSMCAMFTAESHAYMGSVGAGLLHLFMIGVMSRIVYFQFQLLHGALVVVCIAMLTYGLSNLFYQWWDVEVDEI